jgi:protein O-GlcNAc transferase
MDTLRSSDPADCLRQAWSELAAGNWAAAVELAGRALASGDHMGQALHVQALARWGDGDAASALNLLNESASHGPSNATLLSDLGVLRYVANDWRGAIDAFSGCLQRQPGDLTALRGLADSLLQVGRYSDAEAVCRQWIAAAGDEAGAYRVLAQCLAFDGRWDDAAAAAARSLVLDPQSEQTLLLLSAIRQGQRYYELALDYCQTAVRLHPESATAWARLAIALWDAGDPERGFAAASRATELNLADPDLIYSLDWIALHDPRQTASSLLERHRNSVPIRRGPTRLRTRHASLRDRDPEKPLRVGYLSGEFVSNAAYCFLTPWLRHHDPKQVETIYYMSSPRQDEITAHYRRMAGLWREVWSLSPDELAQRIRADGVDILVDLSGHFEHNRLTVFARHPAPVAATFPNYPCTTGVDAIDYIFTDKWTTPVGSEEEYAEQPYRLPSGYLVYQPPCDLALSPPPAMSSGLVTFGLFQRPGKLHAGVWDAVASVLSRVPRSRLLVHFASAELDQEGAGQRARIIALLESRSIPSSRLSFRGTRHGAGHLAVVAEADIALDAFPYNGQTTTCDCLWMGVPVVSLRGASHVSRVTPALLERMDLGHLAARTVQQYVDTAAALAFDLGALTRLRSELRESMRTHSLTDGARLAREIESGYRTMWRRWCKNGNAMPAAASRGT